MNGVWKKNWPMCVYEYPGFPQSPAATNQQIVQLVQQAGFNEVHEENIEDLLEGYGESLTNEELLQLEPTLHAFFKKKTTTSVPPPVIAQSADTTASTTTTTLSATFPPPPPAPPPPPVLSPEDYGSDHSASSEEADDPAPSNN
ncbi:Tigger transposable element-derived protein 1-like 205 [Homarus americanus]|uniref:Tigger transposable element-derived protein 1-like 205 n=1 Tax=Homarus americanus TaxID=6706 RepID=A0A8J5JT57_HOMAM|nr:Tigger transposable element-derived protein 1-like 205 [Homarus americanus]